MFLEIRNYWKEAAATEKIFLVVMDEAFIELDIQDAITVIHFDLPSRGRQDAFGKRYRCMWDHFPDVTAFPKVGEPALESAVVSCLELPFHHSIFHFIVYQLSGLL